MKSKALLILGLCLFVIAGGFDWANGSEIDETIKVSLKFDNTPIDAVLKMMATQNDLNLVVSSDVEGQVSIDIKDVSLTVALEALLYPNGYDYYIADNIIIVKSSQTKVAGELIPLPYHLNFIDAETAVAAVTPLLSSKGQAIALVDGNKVVKSENSSGGTDILIFDYQSFHQPIIALIQKIDVRKKQIQIEVKIVETNLGQDENLGINWSKAITTTIGGLTLNNSGTTTSTNNEGLAASMPLETGVWQLGNLSVGQVSALMEFLQGRSNSKLLSNPRLTTSDNITAQIDIQTVIPIQTINRFSEGAVIQDIVTFQDEKVGISLKVTPRINSDSMITMWVNPIVEEIIGYTGPTDNQRPITSERSINTVVTVRHNETIVLGGLMKETKFENKEKVFLLGQIPILGALFTHTKSEIRTTELLIFITPRILAD